MTFTLSSTSAAEFMEILAFNVIAGIFTFWLARYLRPRQHIARGVCMLSFGAGWLVGSVILFGVYQATRIAGVEIPDAAKILLAIAVLYLLMDKVFDWASPERTPLLPLRRNRWGH